MLFSIGVNRKSIRRELVVDLMVPASVASRYRARLAAIDAREAELSFPFCPSVFSSGVLVSCPASISIAVAVEFVQLSGILRIERVPTGASGRLRFSSPASPTEIETLSRLCGLEEPTPASAELPSAEPSQASARAAVPSGSPAGDAAPAWLRVIGG